MEKVLEFSVIGRPWEKGNPKAFIEWPRKEEEGKQPHARQRYDSDPLKVWHEAVTNAATKAMFYQPRLLSGTLGIVTVFKIPRPKAHYSADGLLKPAYVDASPIQDRTGINLLQRAIVEGIEGIVIHSRNQFLFEIPSKEFAEGGGATIRIYSVSRVDVATENPQLMLDL